MAGGGRGDHVCRGGEGGGGGVGGGTSSSRTFEMTYALQCGRSVSPASHRQLQSGCSLKASEQPQPEISSGRHAPSSHCIWFALSPDQ